MFFLEFQICSVTKTRLVSCNVGPEAKLITMVQKQHQRGGGITASDDSSVAGIQTKTSTGGCVSGKCVSKDIGGTMKFWLLVWKLSLSLSLPLFLTSAVAFFSLFRSCAVLSRGRAWLELLPLTHLQLQLKHSYLHSLPDYFLSLMRHMFSQLVPLPVTFTSRVIVFPARLSLFLLELNCHPPASSLQHFCLQLSLHCGSLQVWLTRAFTKASADATVSLRSNTCWAACLSLKPLPSNWWLEYLLLTVSLSWCLLLGPPALYEP